MNLFNFFKQSRQVAPQETETEVLSTPTSEDLQSTDRQTESVNEPDNLLDLFLNQRFEDKGYYDGYARPAGDFMDMKIRSIQSDFRLVLDRNMDARRSQLAELRMHLIDAKGISERLEARLQERLHQLEVTIRELDTQKILSVEGEGYVSAAINAYRLGFVKGLERYQMEKFFGSETGLFQN